MVALLASYCRLGVAFVPIAIVVMLLTFSIQLGVSNEVNRGGVFKLFAMLIFLLSATGYRNYFKVPFDSGRLSISSYIVGASTGDGTL